jgi:hypothetical protein
MSSEREQLRKRIHANPGSRKMDELALAILDPENATPQMRALRNELLAQASEGTSLSPAENAQPKPEPKSEPEAQPLRVGPALADNADDLDVCHLHTLRAPDVAWEDRNRDRGSTPVGLPTNDGHRRDARVSRPRAS